MKKTIAIMLCLGMALGLSAQKSVNKIIKKYKQHQSATTVTIPKWMIKSGTNFAERFAEGEDEKAYLELGKYLKQIRFMVLEDASIVDPSEIKKFDARSKRDGLEVYTTVRDEGTNIRVLIKEKDNRIKNLVVFAQGEELFVLNIKADLPFDLFKKANFSFNKN